MERPSPADEDLGDLPVLEAIIQGIDASLWAAAGPDHGFQIRFWNRGAERIYGYTAEDAIGQNYLDLFVDEYEREQASLDHAEIVETGRTYRNLANDKAADGSVRRMLTMGFPLRDPADGAWLLGELGVDVSDLATTDELALQRVRETAIRQEETRNLEALVGDLTEMYLELAEPRNQDSEAEALRVGIESIMHFVGVHIECAVWLGDFAHPEQPVYRTSRWAIPASLNLSNALADCREGRMRQVMFSRSGPQTRAKVARYLRGNTRMSESWLAVPLNSREHTVALLVIAFQSWAELRPALRTVLPVLCLAVLGHAHLIRQIRIRNEEAQRLADEAVNLRLNQDFAHRIRKAVDPIVRSVIDLRRAIGSATLDQNTDVAELLDDIEKASRELGTAPDALRRLAQRMPVDLATLIKYIHNRLLIELPDIEIVTHLSEEDVRVYGARGELETLLNDLTYNAAEAMEGRGSIRFTVGAIGSIAFVEVHDDGPGVSNELAERIFKPGVSTKGDGHGYGLARARQICTDLGGSISLMPSTKGARFRVELPISVGGEHGTSSTA